MYILYMWIYIYIYAGRQKEHKKGFTFTLLVLTSSSSISYKAGSVWLLMVKWHQFPWLVTKFWTAELLSIFMNVLLHSLTWIISYLYHVFIHLIASVLREFSSSWLTLFVCFSCILSIHRQKRENSNDYNVIQNIIVLDSVSRCSTYYSPADQKTKGLVGKPIKTKVLTN